MRFLIVGLGSMGKRRIRNLTALNADELLGFDPREDRRRDVQRDYQVPVYADFDEAMAAKPDAVVISTPPELHAAYVRAAVAERCHWFSEVGVGTAGLEELARLTAAAGVVGAPSCTLRFHPIVREMKRLVDADAIGRILTFSSHSGQYLPDWHPWEDYRSFWASSRHTGACREQFVLEAIWLTWVLGPIRGIACFKGKLTDLDTTIDDAYQIIVRLERGTLGHVMLDVISRVPFRNGRCFGEQGVIEWSLTDRRLRWFLAGENRWQEFGTEGQLQQGYVHAEEMYVREMEQFVSAVRCEAAWPFTLVDEFRIQAALEAAERSATAGQTQTLEQTGAPWQALETSS